jgi:protein subunit release factor A
LQYKDIIVTCCEEREQSKNREIAFGRLKKIVEDRQRKAEYQQLTDDRNQQNQNLGKRGSFLRNYNYQRDEVSGDDGKTSLKKFLKGDLSDVYKTSGSL